MLSITNMGKAATTGIIEIEETLKNERHDESSYRDYAMFVLATTCMLREIEMSRCDKNDIIQIGTQYGCSI